MKKVAPCILAITLLSSCHIYKSYERPEVETTSLYRDTLAATDTLNLGNLPWQEVFRDTTLQTLIQEGLSNNADLQSAYLRVKEAEATLLSSRLAYLPSPNLQPQGTLNTVRQRLALTNFLLLPVGKSTSSATCSTPAEAPGPPSCKAKPTARPCKHN